MRLGKPTVEGVPWEARGSLRTLLGTLSLQLASPTGFALSGQGHDTVDGPLLTGWLDAA